MFITHVGIYPFPSNPEYMVVDMLIIKTHSNPAKVIKFGLKFKIRITLSILANNLQFYHKEEKLSNYIVNYSRYCCIYNF